MENPSVHGFKNFARFAHHTTTRDGLELSDSKALFAPRREIEPSADAAGLFGKSAESMKTCSFGKFVKWGNLGEVLHQVPDGVLGDDALCHAMGPPALLIKLGELNPLGQPYRQVIVEGAAFLQFGHPHVAKGHPPTFAPFANGLQAPRYVARLPVVNALVCQGAEPDIFAKAFWRSESVKVSTGPDGTS